MATNVAALLALLPPHMNRRHGRILLGKVLNLTEDQVFCCSDHPVTQSQSDAFMSLLARLTGGEPLSRILGYRDFWKLRFHISAETLDPRPDSETLVSCVLDYLHTTKITSPRVLDLGTGSGCLLLSLLSELPNATGVGVDISFDAVKTARQNSILYGLDTRSLFVQGNWLDALACDFDVILSNPPYISTAEFADLDANVREFDPYRALVSGATGIEFYEVIMKKVKKFARKRTFLAFEIGWKQKSVLMELASAFLSKVACAKDLGGNDRVISGILRT